LTKVRRLALATHDTKICFVFIVFPSIKKTSRARLAITLKAVVQYQRNKTVAIEDLFAR
jgi:hypothetical protein